LLAAVDLSWPAADDLLTVDPAAAVQGWLQDEPLIGRHSGESFHLTFHGWGSAAGPLSEPQQAAASL
jgi:hypothetical protein